jgi:hypothetical protein
VFSIGDTLEYINLNAQNQQEKTKPPIVQVKLTWNAKGTIWAEIWRYNEEDSEERELKDLDELTKVLGGAITFPSVDAIKKMHEEWNNE